MLTARVIEIPAQKAAYSGPLTSKEIFTRFNRWFTGFHAKRNELFPRCFMRCNGRLGTTEWFYALRGDETPADLDNAEDWLKTRDELIEWANASGRFRPYENGEGKIERYPMFQIVSLRSADAGAVRRGSVLSH